MTECYHCGDPCPNKAVESDGKFFCCRGCQTVFDILHDNNLGYYYDLEQNPGISPKESTGKFDFLENEAIAEKLLEFNDGKLAVISFSIPSIHCSSCIWVLENLNKINKAVKTSQVNFPKKTLRITFERQTEEGATGISLKNLVNLLSRLGYAPTISLEDSVKKTDKTDRSLIYKMAIAGFAFGNIMFLSLPEYFSEPDFWLDQFKPFFRWLMFGLSLPVVFYAAGGYFKSAFKGLRSGNLNIDIPIALGIATLFIRSTIDIVFDFGTGYFDSMAGLVFFLLIGKFFQQKTYSYLSFERDYKSYFPLAVTRISKATNGETKQEQVDVNTVKKGERLLIKNNEILPADAVLIKGKALIDYSFVTGEADPIAKTSGEKLFAGAKQTAGLIEVEVLKPVAQSYLTQLWSNDVFKKEEAGLFRSITDKVSKHFTIAVLLIACLSTGIWVFIDPSKAFFVFTAVLIVACPCAIALAAPFTLGNGLRIFGRQKLFLKEAPVIEKMAAIDTVVFDKTGTLTTSQKNSVRYEGVQLTANEQDCLTAVLQASQHPLSQALFKVLGRNNIMFPDNFTEETGKGIAASVQQNTIRAGAYDFVNAGVPSPVSSLHGDRQFQEKTSVHINVNNHYRGCYNFKSQYREGISELFDALSATRETIVLSGDNEGERAVLETLLPNSTTMYFNRKPDDKLTFVKTLQQRGRKVMMIGDGLNDAGALKQSDVGLVVSENTNVFTPASDGILEADHFSFLPTYFRFAQKSVRIIKLAFLLSLLYNIIGLGFAVSGHLRPVVAAILMPLSSISIVAFTTLATNLIGKTMKPRQSTPY